MQRQVVMKLQPAPKGAAVNSKLSVTKAARLARPVSTSPRAKKVTVSGVSLAAKRLTGLKTQYLAGAGRGAISVKKRRAEAGAAQGCGRRRRRKARKLPLRNRGASSRQGALVVPWGSRWYQAKPRER